MLEHFTVEEPEFELYFEVTSSLRLTELRVELLDQEEKVVQNLCGFITPRGVYSESTLIPGEPLGPRTWGIRILAQKESGWLLLANGRPVLDAPAPASPPPGRGLPWRMDNGEGIFLPVALALPDRKRNGALPNSPGGGKPADGSIFLPWA